MNVTTDATSWFDKLDTVGDQFFVRLPPWEQLTDEQQAAVEAGGKYPIIISDTLPAHDALVTYLVERSLEAWARSEG